MVPAALSAALLLAGACSESPLMSPLPDSPASGAEIRLQAEIDQINSSRADDSGFADGDNIGVYVVDFGADGQPSPLTPDARPASNVKFTFDAASGQWTGERPLYFTDDHTPADVYGYYPYREEMPSTESMRHSVSENQNTASSGRKLSGYESSDLLVAASGAVSPSVPLINLVFRHVMAGIQVTLVEGEGFDDGEWQELEKSVIVGGTLLDAEVDIASGNVTPASDSRRASIIAAASGMDFRAVAVPQTVPSGTVLLTLNVGSDSYRFVRDSDMEYLSGSLHKFTIEVTKSLPSGDYEFSLIGEAITAWESDPASHDGKLKEYRVVDVPQAGGLRQALESAGIKYSGVVNLKITGQLNHDDFFFMRENMKQVEALSLKDAVCQSGDQDYPVGLPVDAFNGMKLLGSIVFPDKMQVIGGGAFRNTNLSGSLNLPEGLVKIGGSAFSNWGAYTDCKLNLTGTLTLPSTLKIIESSAFENNNFTGRLILPEGLQEIGDGAFKDCAYISGPLKLPSTLKVLGVESFQDARSLSGRLEIPSGITVLERAFASTGFSIIVVPQHLAALGNDALAGTTFRGDFIVPETVTAIGEGAFRNSRFSHVVLPQKLEFLNDRCFQGCGNLIDTIIVPPLIETVGAECFQGCTQLDAIVLPGSVTRIKEFAFENCRSLTYLRCDAAEPPAVPENAFQGINKDNFTVEVPEASVDKYRQAPGWREFRRISAYRGFVARPSKYNVLNNGGTRTIVLNADDAWELTSIPSWCSVNVTSGNKKTELTLTVDRLPHGAGNRSDIVEFRLAGDGGHTTHVNVSQYDYDYDEDALVQLSQSSRGKGINLFVVGDGFDAADIASGEYLAAMEREAGYMFAVEPYASYRDYFNVYTAIALSDDSGVEDVNHWRTTKFHTVIANSDSRLSSDYNAAMAYCAEVMPSLADGPEPQLGMILVANSDIYEGVTYSDYGRNFCAVVTMSTLDYPFDARGLVLHEAGGHGFGRLADEYSYHQAYLQKCTCVCCEHKSDLELMQSYGYGLNLSLQGRSGEVPWRHLMFHPDYSSDVDIYEGGFFHSRGVYRSEFNSCMNNNVSYYSAWSRELIVRNIVFLAGEEFNPDDFYATDRRAIGQAAPILSRSASAVSLSMSCQAPVFVRSFEFDRKGGRK